MQLLGNMKSKRPVQVGFIIIVSACVLWYILTKRANTPYHSNGSGNPDKTSTFDDNQDQKMKQRIRTIEELCRRPDVVEFHTRLPEVVKNWYQYNQTGICTCKVPKAASTFLGKILLLGEYPDRADYLKKLPAYQVHTGKIVNELSTKKCHDKTSMSFFVTRDPYSRLFSAYVDKIYLGKHTRLTKELYFKYNTDPDEQKYADDLDVCTVYNVTFEQFLEYVTSRQKLDSHVAPVSLMCNPCQHRFDVIIKQENLLEEAAYLLDKMKVDLDLKKYATDYLEVDVEDTGVKNLIHSLFGLFLYNQKMMACSVSPEDYADITQRFWGALKMLGYIEHTLPLMEDIFYIKDGIPGRPEFIYSRIKEKNIRYLNATERKLQRHRFVAQAYDKVSIATIAKIQKLFRFDFILFGYDITPPRM